MTDQIEKPELEIPELPELPKVDELTALKKRADVLGISYGPNIGAELLRARINAKIDGTEEPTAEEQKAAVTQELEAPAVPLTEGQRKALKRKQMWLEEMKLIRCRIVNLNPDEADLKGEFFTVQNQILGKVTKYIPYGEETDEGYHIPNILYKNLLEKKFVQLKIKKSSDPFKREMLPEQRWVREFAIEVLPPLTKDELRILANKQAASAGLAV